MGKLVKELKGHSGCKIYLMQNDEYFFVRKIGDISRNLERLNSLSEYSVPKIYKHDLDYIDMEYIHGLDIKTYLKHNNVEQITEFIVQTLNSFRQKSKEKNYTEIYDKKLNWINSSHELPFTKEEFIERLPKILPSSVYHGDMTLENMLHTKEGFIMIDPVTIEYDSYIFDIAKMRQDLECKWFLRNENYKLTSKLKKLQENILSKFPVANDDNLLILMLLRVFLHTQKGDSNHQFIMKWIKKLWK